MKYFPPFLGIIIALLFFLIPIIKSGPRELSRLESVQSIAYPLQDGSSIITQNIAHADIYLREPVLAKNLTVRITFSPGNANRLSAGIRSSSFWLSYQPQVFYDRHDSPAIPGKITAELTFPLTDKFQEKDRSLDLMLFSDYVPAEPGFDLGLADTAAWQVHSLTASVSPAVPGWRAVADYAASLLLRERAA